MSDRSPSGTSVRAVDLRPESLHFEPWPPRSLYLPTTKIATAAYWHAAAATTRAWNSSW
jgi:hypothetical protein